MTILVGYLLAFVVGASLGVFGAGGSILTVPNLVYIMGTQPVQATAYSLVVVGLTSAVGAAAYIRRRQVNLATAVLFAVPSVTAVYLTRRFLVPAMPEHIVTLGSMPIGRDLLVMVLFGIVMVWAATAMIRPRRVSEPDTGPGGSSAGGAVSDEAPGTRSPSDGLGPSATATAAVDSRHRAWLPIAIEGAGVGVVTGLVGAGGGFLIVPVLVLAGNMEMRQAVGTSLVIITLKSLIGFLGDVGAGREIEWGFLALFSLLAAGGVIGGSVLSARLPGERLRPWFGWFVLIAGIMIIAGEIE